MYDVEFYDSHVGRKMAVNMGRTGELTMTVDEWEKFCRLMLLEINREREKIRLTNGCSRIATAPACEGCEPEK